MLYQIFYLIYYLSAVDPGPGHEGGGRPQAGPQLEQDRYTESHQHTLRHVELLKPPNQPIKKCFNQPSLNATQAII